MSPKITYLLALALLIFGAACKTSEERQEEVEDWEPSWKEQQNRAHDTKEAVESIDKERLRQLEELDS